jgi:hypothetical protein
MDPIVLATITSALTLISTEVTKGAASEAGKALWGRIRSMLGWTQDPKASDLAPEIARKLAADPGLAKELTTLLQSDHESSQQASTLVQSIDAEKVIVVGTMNVSGGLHM